MITGIVVTGQEGVWRLLNGKSHALHQDVVGRMEEDLWNIQPECHGFVLMEW